MVVLSSRIHLSCIALLLLYLASCDFLFSCINPLATITREDVGLCGVSALRVTLSTSIGDPPLRDLNDSSRSHSDSGSNSGVSDVANNHGNGWFIDTDGGSTQNRRGVTQRLLA